MMTIEDRNAMLEVLNIYRWSLMPIEKGIISFITKENKKVAEGNYEIILSHGPEEEFTMAYGISIYTSMNAPVIKPLPDCPLVHPGSLADAEAFAFKVGEQLQKDFVLDVMHVYVGVSNFQLTEPVDVEALNISKSLSQMLRDLSRIRKDQQS
ncbi:hypothetical protein [Xanthocytophaga agilis]|uniref:Uncharacterized protein n=1 Tax=Xanthocytophaga agilis TaxID=3048010 RepID=A0AAE3UGT1_9BACT|nr:hypothetical protein [Xanthocytophaga agilis]MDJ1505303.1 hypothetical protein [Xanthocytophaga agilis]